MKPVLSKSWPRWPAACLAVPLLSASLAVAERGHHGAHVHGLAELAIALEGETAELLLTAPAVSIVGFEHRAANAGQVRAVTEAEAQLRDTETLFAFTGGACTFTDVALDLSAVQGEEEHDDHDEHHEDEHHEEETHSDITARYTYSCNATAELESLRLGGGALPFHIEDVNVMWVSERGQGATRLDADNQRIEFR